MAEKRNDIIEEQRKAREEFLKLKKMQQGELKPQAKPSEIAVVPKTFGEKAANFWFHYKIHTLLTIFMVILLSVGITQCATRESYDFEIMYFTYTPAVDVEIDKVEEYFETLATDADGDGKINVLVKNCSVTDSNKDASRTLTFSKIQSIMVADYSVVLYVVDQKAIDYFNNALDYSIFVEEPTPLGADFYKATEIGGTRLPDGLKVGLRIIKGTQFEGKDEADRAFEAGKQVLEKIKKQNS